MPPPFVRRAVRDILDQTPGFAELDAVKRRALAHAMVNVSSLAAQLILDESNAQQSLEADASRRRRAPLARAQDQPDFAAAADRVAGTTRAVLNAVSFPRFVTDLINGVFKAMLDSNAQQMHQYVELLNNVSASLEGFANSQYTDDAARAWLVDKFPAQFEMPDPAKSEDGPVDPEDVEPRRLRLRDGAHLPDEEALRTVFGLGPEDSIDASNPEQLVPLARRQVARQRQQMLATMVMLGMQRIVVDSGSIHASMRFHIDTRSAANQDQGSTLSEQNRIKAAGSFGVGAWGASAEMENNIGYVSTQRNQGTEELNTDLELNSSVDINFRSDYVPLNRMTSSDNASRIRANSLNPDSEAAIAKATADREASQRAAEIERQKLTNAVLAPQAQPAAKPPAPAPAPAAKSPAPAASGQAGAKTPAPSAAGQPTAKTPAPAVTGQPTAKTPAPAATAQPTAGAPAPTSPTQPAPNPATPAPQPAAGGAPPTSPAQPGAGSAAPAQPA